MKIKSRKILVGKRIKLRLHKHSLIVAKQVFKTVDKNREHLSKFLTWVDATNRVEDTLKYLLFSEMNAKQRKSFEYGIYLNNKYIGNINLFNVDQKNNSAEVGYWLSKEVIGNGYMAEAVSLVEELFFAVWEGHRLVIGCDSRNKASRRVAEKAGYKLDGVLRNNRLVTKEHRYRDSMVFSKLKDEFDKERN